jgi:membrane protease YdiL (CAAX protease family)
MNQTPASGSRWHPVAGVVAALVITTAMDAGGLAMFSSLALLPLAILFWILGRYSRREMGLVLGAGAGYRWALIYPLVVPGALTLAAFAFGAVDLTEAEWGKAGRNLAIMASTGILGTLLTEEGFFRGWLWGALKRNGQGDRAVLVWTSVIFSLWHLSAVVLETDFAPPRALVPVFMVNATLLGLNWGLMRQVSGSVFPVAISHAVWNALVYGLFGFGEKAGVLGVTQTWLFGPELGVLGVVGNGLFALVLWRRVMTNPGRREARY